MPDLATLDLLVLGGGVTGLGIARLASQSGWSVALAERGDLASGASSASSHMLHGGLRYLEHGHLGLVREALHERRALIALAPTLAHETRFLAPVHAGARVPAWKLRLGLWLYDLLAGSTRLTPNGWADAARAASLEPALAREKLVGAGLYSDAVMDDARLAIAVARDAAAHGARLHPRTTLTALREREGGVLEATLHGAAGDATLAVRAIVNATGAWSDQTRADVLAMLRPGTPAPPPRLAPSRGTHLVYPALTSEHGLVMTAARDGRVFFVVPFAGRSLVGTTEVAVGSRPRAADSLATREEIAYLHAEVSRVLPGAAASRPLAVFAGLRPLLASTGGVGGAPREHDVREDGALVSIAGGKWTTFRVMAADALRPVARRLGRAAPRDTSDAPLPAPPDGADPGATGEHAARDAFATTLADALRRRSTLWLADDGGIAVAPRVAEGMARVLGWNEATQESEVRAWQQSVQAQRDLIASSL